MKPQCTPSTQRRVRRWEHEAVLEEMQLRLSKAPEMMRVRKRTVEHPFGTLKQWMFIYQADRPLLPAFRLSQWAAIGQIWALASSQLPAIYQENPVSLS